MKRFLMVGTILVLGLASVAGAEDFNWSISASSTDPNVNSGSVPLGGAGVLYLWLECSLINEPVSALEAEVESSWPFIGYTPIHPSVNVGSGNTLQLEIDGCPSEGTLVGALGFDFQAEGRACLRESAANGVNESVTCDEILSAYSNAVTGFSSDGEPYCVLGSCTIIYSTERTRWSAIKAMYR